MGTETRARIDVFSTSDALAQAAASRFVSAADEAIQASGRFVVALSGGSTPKGLYARLVTEPYVSRVEWSRVHWFWGDERCVPPGDPASNHRMTREALLDRLPVSEARVHRIRGEDDPAEAAAAYERTLRATFATPAGARFDLVLLGMGDDGHTASLFPGTAAVRERERWVMAEYARAESMWRVTLTPVVINAAADVAFLVVGREKAAMLRRVLEGSYQPDAVPAQAIAPVDGHLRWLVDVTAAADLTGKMSRP
ncbi:MAG: 6-phosphogluconolactonase [Candidatus Rokuibacteriota bacterium]